jgi:hypothetical protein
MQQPCHSAESHAGRSQKHQAPRRGQEQTTKFAKDAKVSNGSPASRESLRYSRVSSSKRMRGLWLNRGRERLRSVFPVR